MENYIYIIIGVLWLAASIYRSSQKKKEAAAKKGAQSSEKPKSGMSGARSLLEELLGGQEVKIPEPEEYEVDYAEQETVVADPKPQGRKFEYEYATSNLGKTEALSGEGIRSTDRILFKEALGGSEKKSKGQHRINLRKAIIYSTILERPYF